MNKSAIGCYADGGVAQQFPPVLDPSAGEQAAAPAPQAPGPAIGGPTVSANPVGNSAEAGSGDGTKNDFGFDAKEVLGSWRKADHDKQDVTHANVNPIRFGLAGMQELYTGTNGANAAGISAVDGGHSNMANAIRTRDGAMNDKQYQQLGQGVDPNHQLDVASGYIARLDATSKYALANGDKKSGQRIVQSLIQYGGLQSEKFGSYAVEMIKRGDLAGATKMLSRAYDWSPDGNRLEAFVGPDGLAHAKTINTATGEETDLGKFDAQHVLKVALGVANGTEYMRHLAQVAGMKPDPVAKPEKAPTAPKEPTLSVRHAAEDKIAAELGKIDEKSEAGKKWKELPEEFKAEVARAASQIHASNDMDAAKSIQAAKEIAGAALPAPGPDGVTVVKLKDGSVVRLHPNAAAQIKSISEQNKTYKTDAEKKAADKAALDSRAKDLAARADATAAEIRDNRRRYQSMPLKERLAEREATMGPIKEAAQKRAAELAEEHNKRVGAVRAGKFGDRSSRQQPAI